MEGLQALCDKRQQRIALVGGVFELSVKLSIPNFSGHTRQLTTAGIPDAASLGTPHCADFTIRILGRFSIVSHRTSIPCRSIVEGMWIWVEICVKMVLVSNRWFV